MRVQEEQAVTFMSQCAAMSHAVNIKTCVTCIFVTFVILHRGLLNSENSTAETPKMLQQTFGNLAISTMPTIILKCLRLSL